MVIKFCWQPPTSGMIPINFELIANFQINILKYSPCNMKFGGVLVKGGTPLKVKKSEKFIKPKSFKEFKKKFLENKIKI